ncbi:hypothetical protein R6Q59_011074 [Mikania micrantha]
MQLGVELNANSAATSKDLELIAMKEDNFTNKEEELVKNDDKVQTNEPRLHPADAAILRDLIGSVRDLSGRVGRLEEMMRWMTERMAASAGMNVPVFPGPGHHADHGSHA